MFKCFGSRGRFGRGIRLDDCDVSVEGGAVSDGEVRSTIGVGLLKWTRFYVSGCSSVASMTVESLDNKVVTSSGFESTNFLTAHWMGVEVGWDEVIAEGTRSRRRDTRNEKTKTKVAEEAEVTIRERSVRRGGKGS